MTVTRKTKDLSTGVRDLLEKNFDGKIVVGQGDYRVSFYLFEGQLLWVQDRLHPRRRWQRAVKKIFANSDPDLDSSFVEKIDNYAQLTNAVVKQYIGLNQARSIISEVARECFSELFIQQELVGELIWNIDDSDGFLNSNSQLALSAEETEKLILNASLLGKQWQNSQLGTCFLSLSPVIEQEQQYDAVEMPIPKTYFNGDYTIWDIIAGMKSSVILMAGSLLNLKKQKIIKLQAISDSLESKNGNGYVSRIKSPLDVTQEKKNYVIERSANSVIKAKKGVRNSKPAYDPSKPLIACIDDSPVLVHSVKKILGSVGYQAIMISEPLAGMGLLAKYRPNLILLDLLMPTVNGYSVCKFLRETSIFKTTPIVILTSKDTIVDRTKAKLVGATDFLAKPPGTHELLQVIRQHITDIPLG